MASLTEYLVPAGLAIGGVVLGRTILAERAAERVDEATRRAEQAQSGQMLPMAFLAGLFQGRQLPPGLRRARETSMARREGDGTPANRDGSTQPSGGSGSGGSSRRAALFDAVRKSGQISTAALDAAGYNVGGQPTSRTGLTGGYPDAAAAGLESSGSSGNDSGKVEKTRSNKTSGGGGMARLVS